MFATVHINKNNTWLVTLHTPELAAVQLRPLARSDLVSLPGSRWYYQFAHRYPRQSRDGPVLHFRSLEGMQWAFADVIAAEAG